MKISANFQSAVIIGAFNPMIMTPDFLKSECGFKSDHEPKGQTTPVATEIVFGNTHFLAELNKFQITVHGDNEFDDIFPWNLAVDYLSVLKFTPLQMAGVNFNYTISDLPIQAVKELFDNPWEIGPKIDCIPTSVSMILRKRNSDGLDVAEIAITHSVIDNIKNNLKIVFEGDQVTVNNNFEVASLDVDRNRISALAGNFAEFVKLNKQFVGKMVELK